MLVALETYGRGVFMVALDSVGWIFEKSHCLVRVLLLDRRRASSFSVSR